MRLREIITNVVGGLLCFHAFVSSSAQRMDEGVAHSKYIQAVDEYRPAPGQYVNDIPE